MPIGTFDRHLVTSTLDHERAVRFVTRMSWVVVAVLCVMVAAMWVAPFSRAAGHLRVARLAALAFAISFFALIGLVVVLRRKLAAQVSAVRSHLDVRSAQNAVLAEQNSEAEHQNELLQQQTAELEMQAEELQERTADLLQSNDALRLANENQNRLLARLDLLSRRLSEAQEVAQLGYWEIDCPGGAVFWSDEMYRLCGLEPRSEIAPTDHFLSLLHPEDRPRAEAVATRAISQLTEFTEQYRLIRDAGDTRMIQAKGRAIVDRDGGRKLIGTVQDITAQHRLEIQLQQAQKMDALGRLAGGVAHDFNNILTVIEGYAGLMLVDIPEQHPARPSITEIRSAVRSAATLTRQLLAVSRRQVLQPRVLNVNETISGIDGMLRRVIGEHIEFRTKLDPQLSFVKADPGQLEQVLMNLVVNARDAMPNGGRVTVETANVVLDASNSHGYRMKPVGPHVMLAVSDTGTGISPELLDRIFEPFFTTKESSGGTGLGLSTVQGIVEQSGGHVWVYSEPGRGTTFKIYLPSTQATPVGVPVIEPRAIARGSETILLVEDAPALRKVAASILTRAGYAVIEAARGDEALAVCRDVARPISLMITDMVMPGMRGTQLAIEARKLRAGLPVVLMSGYTRDAALNDVDLEGATVFLEKPFTPETLTLQVRAALG